MSPELAGAGGLLIMGAVVAALVAHYQSSSPSPGLVGDYRVAPAAAAAAAPTPAAAAATAWTPDGPFTVRVDGLACTAAASTGAPVTCTLRVEARSSGTVPRRYLPPRLLAGDGAPLTLLGDAAGAADAAGSAGTDVAPGRTVPLVYRFRAPDDLTGRPASRLLLGNGAPADALSVRHR
jgi:hypothetical protein